MVVNNSMTFTVHKNKNFAGIVFFYFKLITDCQGEIARQAWLFIGILPQ